MAQLSRKIVGSRLRRTIRHRISVVRLCVLRFLHSLPACYGGHRYRMLPPPLAAPPSPLTSPTSPPPCSPRGDGGELVGVAARPLYHTNEVELGLDPDIVALKISLLGDCQIGKTSFLVKYVGDESEEEWKQRGELNQMDKTLDVRGARISYCIWEVSGNRKLENQIHMACKDSVAILIMFDLTSRCTLNSVLEWYWEARKYNQSAIPVLVGTKFDDFIQLPLDLQWAIASQARAYAKAINATLFFSSSTYNINVNKIFKFITAKLFDLPWTVERNLRMGEPIIDF